MLISENKLKRIITKIINEVLSSEEDKVVYIMRGIPGSGKSTRARELVKPENIKNIFSTDDYFMVGGEYRFDPTKLGEYHGNNLQRFKDAVMQGISPIVVDNTNTQKWEYAKYEEFAKDNGYRVEVVAMPLIPAEDAVQRNTHGVSQEVIEKMISRWEP